MLESDLMEKLDESSAALCVVRDIGGFPLITVGNYFVVLFDPVLAAEWRQG